MFWRILLGSSSDGDLIFTRAGEQPTFLFECCMEPTMWTMNAGNFQSSKWGKVKSHAPPTQKFQYVMECTTTEKW